TLEPKGGAKGDTGRSPGGLGKIGSSRSNCLLSRTLAMPRTSRAPVGGYCYHVLNRGNARAEVFHKERDFQAFLDMIGGAKGDTGSSPGGLGKIGCSRSNCLL